MGTKHISRTQRLRRWTRQLPGLWRWTCDCGAGGEGPRADCERARQQHIREVAPPEAA